MIVSIIHDFLCSLFPEGTNDFIMHIVVMFLITTIVHYFIPSKETTLQFIILLGCFIEIEQFIFNTGTCDVFDVCADAIGCLLYFDIKIVFEKHKKILYNIYIKVKKGL